MQNLWIALALVALVSGCEQLAGLSLGPPDLGAGPGGDGPRDQALLGDQPPPVDLPPSPDSFPDWFRPWEAGTAGPAWLTQIPTAAPPTAVAVDGAGNTFVAASLFQASSMAATLYKLDASGAVQWAKGVGTSDVVALAVDSAGVIHLARAGPAASVAALDASGGLLWETPTDNGRQPFALCLDSLGNGYVTGDAGFVEKILATGKKDWAAPLPSFPEPTSTIGRGIAVDGAGNVYAVGELSGAGSFGTHAVTSAGFADAYIARLDPTGQWSWAVSAGGPASAIMGGPDSALGIAVDPAGNSIVSGLFAQTATFGTITRTAASERDIFVAGLDPSGTFLWVTSGGGNAGSTVQGIGRDGAGNVTIAGAISGSGSLGGLPVTGADVDLGLPTLLVAKLGGTGQALWASTVINALAVTLAVDGAGAPHLAGTFSGTATFGKKTLTSAGGELFVARMTPWGSFD